MIKTTVVYPKSAERYALVTAARNEAAFIERTIQSVAAQTLLPQAWVIVSDGSTDETDDTVNRYVNRHPFIQLIRLERNHHRNFAAKVNAVVVGFRALENVNYDFIGNLDADISFGATYFCDLLDKFRVDPQLGLAGGWIHELSGGEFRSREFNSPESVPHAVHLLRRACYESIGDYLPLPYGGEDTHAVVRARMNGWKAQAFSDLTVFHHRRTATAGGLLRSRLRMGLMDHSLGYHPGFEILKCIRRVGERPWLASAILRLVGYGYGYLRNEPRLVSPEFVSFVRTTQKKRVSALLRL